MIRTTRKILLLPLGLIWGIIAQIKRHIYSFFQLRNQTPITSIVIGNINVGGLGKTPTITWLFNLLLELKIPAGQIGILSRGYGRKTEGYITVKSSENALSVGDEPLEILEETQTLLSHENPIIAVCENRILGIEKMLLVEPSLQLVLLDDGFQHLNLKSNASILLCDFHHPFTIDLPLPAGNLREFPMASKEATALLVCNCPLNFNETEAEAFKSKIIKHMKRWMICYIGGTENNIHWENNIGFTSTKTTQPVHHISKLPLQSQSPVLLITGIANPERILNQIGEYALVKHISYPDHHLFTLTDIQDWISRYQNLQATHPSIALLTTRKDYMRLKNCIAQLNNLPLYVIHSEIQPLFNTQQIIINSLTPILHAKKNQF